MFATIFALAAIVSVPQMASAGLFDGLLSELSIQSVQPVEPNGNDEVQQYAAGDKGTKTSDLSTLDAWNEILTNEGQATTQNIGRIWTDKSVFTDSATFTEGPLANTPIDVNGDHDFLVGLSALSSTSNTTTTTYTNQPLDIVLVLDDSGSMAYGIDSDMQDQVTYTPIASDQVVESHGELRYVETGDWFWREEGNRAYQLTEPEDTYYVSLGGRWVEVVEETNRIYGDGDFNDTSYREHVRWMANGQEVDPETTQFCTRTVYDMSERRGALQYAVSNFIDQTAEMNATIADENKKIRLSLVVFESDATIENHLTVCEGDNVADLKATLEELHANGATNAGAGMTSANNELRQYSTRDNTKQVVIFFTDGVPTTSNSFSSSVANIAVTQAGQIKDRGGSVYSIGIFDGADPSQTDTGWNPNDTDRANVFMNAVSSNYPDSTSWNNLGRRASGDPDFYKSAENSGQLNEVFQDIFDESTEDATSGSPIEGTDQEGVQDAVPGTLTFTDTLGDYMEVTGDNMTLVYGDTTHTATKGNDGVYRFPDQDVAGNDVYASANLSQIQISIQKGEGSNGDTVTVSMPASFIPLRNYEVTTEDGQSTMTVSEAYPIRLFYGVSVKQDVLDNLGDPNNTALQSYIGANKTDDGTSVNFYANKWSGGDFGDATATFTPNEANKFYYYTENTDLYVDEACKQQATERNINLYDTLYYKDTYWVQEGATGVEREEVLSIARNGQDAQGIAYDRGGNAYIAAGTRRHDRPATLASDKAANETHTASQVLNPTWVNGNTVSQRLGNNGVIPVELPATLAVFKTVEFGGDYGIGFDETPYTEDKSYEMNIHVDGAAGKIYKAEVENAAGDVVSTVDFTLTFDGNGDVKHSIKHGETLYIYGLNGGANYTVSETALGNGWTTEYTNENGALAANGTSTVAVKNTYTLNPATGLGTEIFKGMKVLDGRDWATDGADKFTFQIMGQNGALTPSPATVTVDAATTQVDGKDAAPFNFSDVIYDKPGVYTYTIEEIPPTVALPGMSYSNAAYTVEVTVTDNGNGTMTVSSKMTQTRADNAGDPAAGEVVDKTATFTNRFTESKTTAVLGANKDYQNQSGNDAMDLKDGMFSVELRPTGANAADAPMPEGTTGDGADRVATGVNAGTSMNFARILFTNQMDGQTFTYEIRETQGTVNNMTYDGAKYTVRVTVHVNDQNQVSVDTEYFDANGSSLGTGEGGIATQPTFHNAYKPQEATLTDDAGDAVHGEKTLTGRNMKAGESFGFTLNLLGNITQGAVTAGDIIIADNNWNASVSNGTNGQAAPFTFGDMTFKKAGTYRFAVQETSHNGDTLPTDDTAGMTYDRDVCIVTVTVTDEDGVLKAAVSYNNGDTLPTDRAVFQNTYTSSVDFGNTEGGIQVTKQLDGRNLTPNEFQFSITAVDAQGSVPASEAETKLSDDDRTFSNPTGTMAGVPTVAWKQLAGMTFTQDDAGKTFVYEVRETSQGTETVTTDGTVYTVTLTPQDNGNGTMHVTGSVRGGDMDIAIDTDDENYAAPVLPFVNSYEPLPVSTDDTDDTTLQVTKKVTGANAAGAFEFELALDEDASDNGTDGVFEDADATKVFDGMTVTTKDNLAKDEEQTLSFGQLTFTKAGTYVFKVRETTQSSADYWAYDNAEKTITVEVVDRDGQLAILYAQGNNPTVENKYTAESVIVGGDSANDQITVKKTVTGHASTSAFNFKLEAVVEQGEEAKWQTVSSVDQPYDGKTTVTEGIADGESSTATFGGIRFTAAGEFKFKVTEVEANDGMADPAGWTYDTHESFVTVKVTDDGQGQLHADVAYDNTDATTAADQGTADAAAFTNTYKTGQIPVDEGDARLTIIKNMTGRAIANGEFTFIMTGSDEASINRLNDGRSLRITTTEAPLVDNKASETITVDTGMIFTLDDAGKSYTYTVKEEIPAGAVENEGGKTATLNGVTYDKTEYKVEFKVSDAGEGKLRVETYIDGKLLGDAEAGINAINENTATPPTFNNSYDAGFVTVGDSADVKISATKTLRNDDIANYEGKFKFEVKSGNVVVAEGTNDADNGAGITFGDIAYTTTNLNEAASNDGSNVVGKASVSLDADGHTVYTFDYDVVEVAPTDPGVSPVTVGPLKVMVKVTDLGGMLVAEVSYPNGGDHIEFVNTYGASSEKQVTLGGNKVIQPLGGANNPPALKGGEYTFTIVGSDGAPMPEETEVKNDASGNVTFGPIEFTMENVFAETDDEVDGEEQPGTDDTEPSDETGDETTGEDQSGMTGDETNSGSTSDEDSTTDDSTDTPDDSAVADGSENSDSVTPETDDTDESATADGADSEGDADEAAEPSNDEVGVVLLANEDVDAQTQNRSKTFTYTITESGNVPHVANDTDTEKTVTVTVTDQGNGSLDVVVTPDDGAEEDRAFTFRNTYSVNPEGPESPTDPVDSQITIKKQLTGREIKDGDFTFVMEYTGESEAVAPLSITTTNSNSAVNTSDVIFADQGFTFSAPGTYDFTIREQQGSEEGMTYDGAEYKVQAVVTDNGDNTLSVNWLLLDANGRPVMTDNPTITFTNVYDEPDTPVTPPDPEPEDPTPSDPSKPDTPVTKTLTGRDMVAGEFSFVIEATGDNADKVTPGRLTGTNDASGNVTFSGVGFKFTEADDYTFTVSEVLPADEDPDTPGTQHNGVTYDATTYTVTAHVTENADGKLVVSWEAANGATSFSFNNAYEPSETAQIVFGANKVLNGRDLVAGEFSFELRDAAGNVIATATNAADGSVVFGTPVEFTEAGTYTYLIREVAGSLANVTYDTATHTATVTVTDNGDGTLTATVLYDGSGTLPVFTNTYKVPEEPGEPDKPGKPTEPTKPSKPEEPQKPATPDTGDHTNAAAPVALALSGVALVAGAYVLRVRRNR